MTDLEDFQALAAEMIGEFGTTATLIVPNASQPNDAGEVDEDPTSYAITCSDLVDESRRYATVSTQQVIAGTIYVNSAVPVEPQLGHRVTYQGRTFAIVAAFPYRVQGGIAAWRLDVAEVAGG